jgi:hypothetical protein
MFISYKEKEAPCKIRNLFRKKKIWRPLAQLVEQLAFKQFVEGSNPSRPTNFFLNKYNAKLAY